VPKPYHLRLKNVDIAAIRMFKNNTLLVLFISALLFSGCATKSQPQSKKHHKETLVYDEKNYRLDTKVKPQTGNASYYARRFQGRRTASGEIFNTYFYTAAHRSFPFGAIIRVTMLRTGKSVLLKVNDRGPFWRGRVVDVSLVAAKQLGLIGPGVAKVKVEKLVKID